MNQLGRHEKHTLRAPSRAAAAFMLLGGLACTDPKAPGTYLHVLVAERQPQSSDLGAIVDVQTRGGNYLSFVAQGGSLRLLNTGNGKAASSGACVRVTSDEVTSVLVVPAQSEAILFADLYQITGTTDLGDASSHCITSETAVATSITPIEHVVNSAPSPGPLAPDAGAGGAGPIPVDSGNGGAGGAPNGGAGGAANGGASGAAPMPLDAGALDASDGSVGGGA